jgi:tRNA pseudouridine38-40 synthase
MPRFFLRLSFKGTGYAGWQIQENAVTVQEKLNNGLSVLLNQQIITIGCGRTDTGVHAKQFYAHFDVKDDIDDRAKLVHRLNSILPVGIAIHELIPVSGHLHARFDATERTYEYFISTGKNPFLKEFTMQCHNIPDINLMNEACAYLVQQADFSSFSKSSTQVKTNICHIRKAEWEMRQGLLVFTISADRFLRGMVRAVVGTLMDAGVSKIRPDKIPAIISMKDRSEAGVTVPACGLFLSGIKYPFLSPITPMAFPA